MRCRFSGGDIVLIEFLGRHDHRGHDDVVDGLLETVFVVVLENQRARALPIEFQHLSIEVVVVFQRPIRAKQNREKAQRRNEVAQHLDARGERRRQQQPERSPYPLLTRYIDRDQHTRFNRRNSDIRDLTPRKLSSINCAAI